MKMLAVDLGKFKSTACAYQTQTTQHTSQTLPTRPQTVHDLIVEHAPDRLVIEVGSQAGRVSDLAEALDISDIQVANLQPGIWSTVSERNRVDGMPPMFAPVAMRVHRFRSLRLSGGFDRVSHAATRTCRL